ncbi:putative uncharacterized protein DDB_G0274535 [Arachis ipaensis]|uniref:putative uncharacterized protein DDB_G0274535 n=1 Tax=Arachis ipaensis TaxID=130454 RepID=UPI0007AFCA10|nr:putative uncharacterized protein DDB_G0274535 [Arachis ipaensis]
MKNVTTEASKNLSGAGVDILSSSDQNMTVILSESDHSQNSTRNTTISGDDRVQTDGLVQSDNRNRVSEENLHDSNATATVKTKNGDTSAGESLTLGRGESENARFLASNKTGNGSRNEISDVSEGDNPEGNSGSEDEIFKGDSQTDEMSDESSANGTSDSVDSSEEEEEEEEEEGGGAGRREQRRERGNSCSSTAVPLPPRNAAAATEIHHCHRRAEPPPSFSPPSGIKKVD